MNDPHSMAAHESAAVTARPAQEDDAISLLDLLQLALENLRLLVLVPLAVGLLVLAYTFIVSPTYTAVTRVIPPQQQGSAAGSLLSSLGGFGFGGGSKGSIDQYVTLAKSESLQYALVDRFKLTERYKSKVREDARGTLGDLMRVTGNAKDGLITLEVDDHDPVFAAELANAHIDELNNLLHRLSITEAQQRRLFFEKQMLRAKDGLVKAEEALKLSRVGSDSLKTNPGSAVDELARIKAGITAQEIKLASMRGYLALSAPEFKQAQIELSAMRAQLARAEERQPADANGSSDYISKYREFKYQESLVELFTKQHEVARVDESNEGMTMQVVDVALPPEYKSKPKRIITTIVAAVVAGFATLFFIFLRNAFRRAQEDPELAQKFSNIRKACARALGRT
jgi:uncharacterized protein involved in exopolysaccharide biosynthesis